MYKRIPIFLGIILTILAVWILLTPNKLVRNFIDRLDNLGYDLQIRTYALTQNVPVSNAIAIIDIDDRSLKAEGRWPWSRDKLAELVDALNKQGVAVIAFDMFFSEEENNIAETLVKTLKAENKLDINYENFLLKNAPLFDFDDEFAKSLSQVNSVLALGFLPRNETHNELPNPILTLTPQAAKQLTIYRSAGFISNIPLFQNAAKGGGFINIFPDIDGIIRHSPMLINYKDGIYPSLSLQAVLTFLGSKAELITGKYAGSLVLEGIKLGSIVIPTDARGQAFIPFVGRSYTFPYFSATEVMHGKIAQDALLGKIVFVGTSATGLGDLKATAIQNPFPGVEIQATLANGILQNEFSYKPAWTLGANVVITILFGLIAAFSFPYFGPRILGTIIILLPPLLLFVNNWIWNNTGLILSFVIPVLLVTVIALVNILYGYLFETRKREHLKEMFGQYVPSKHIDEMLKTSSDYGLHGENRDMTVLFADIRNFTTISEDMQAAELVEMLNTLFTPMTEIIFKHRGTIDKYVGDLIMAFWGAPLRDKHHARHAMQTALDMQKRLKALAPMIAEHKWPEIKMGIGINSGDMSVGDMGSRYRRNYTVLGDNVNLASRVEGLSKFYGVDIIVTENTQRHQPRFTFRKLDKVKVKGKLKGIDIYELICYQTDCPEDIQQELVNYHIALENYFQQKWDDAYQQMDILSKKYPDRKIYKIYLERIAEFKQHPVPDDWDGIYAHASK